MLFVFTVLDCSNSSYAKRDSKVLSFLEYLKYQERKRTDGDGYILRHLEFSLDHRVGCETASLNKCQSDIMQGIMLFDRPNEESRPSIACFFVFGRPHTKHKEQQLTK
jgi:hypothetical protein